MSSKNRIYRNGTQGTRKKVGLALVDLRSPFFRRDSCSLQYLGIEIISILY